MLINFFLSKIQSFLKPVYQYSYFLKKIDILTGINILLVIIFSTFAPSDNIGYFALFAILLTLVKLLTKQGEKFNMTLSEKFLLVYFLITLISVSGSTLFYLSLKGFFKTLTYLGFYISIIHYLKDNKDKIKYIFLTYALCISFETVIAFLQNFSSVSEISGWQDMSRLNPEEIMTRVYGTLKPYNPNLFGGFLLSGIPVFLTLPFINKKLTLPAILLGILSVIALILTGCRGAYAGLFSEISVLITITYQILKPLYRKIFTLLVSFSAFIISLVIISITSLRARIFSMFAMRGDSSNSFRFNVYQSCIQMFKDNWLLGIGCGNQNFREIYGLYMRTGFDALSAYNIYLETAVESGVFALIAFLGFIISILVCSGKFLLNKINDFNNLSNNSKTECIFIAACIISLTGILTHGFVDTVFFRPQIQFTFWIMIGIMRTLTAKETNDEF